MFAKLLLRSLARHQKRGKRLFVLLALCSAALVFLLTFQAEFGRQYRDLFVGLQTGHLQILPPDSAEFSRNTWGAKRASVPLLAVDSTWDQWILAQPEVAAAAPILRREGLAYNLDGNYESWVAMVGIPADRLAGVFPGAKTLTGSPDLAWSSAAAEVPFLHARLQPEFGETSPDPDHFLPTDLLDQLGPLEVFKQTVVKDFPLLFDGQTFLGADRTTAFLERWNSGLAHGSLAPQVPATRLATYDWKIDDALAALSANQDVHRWAFLNRRLFQALYPDHLREVREPIQPGKSVTIQVPRLASQGALDLPALIPARYSGLVDILPLYYPNSFLDLDALRHYLGAPEGAATAYVVRLKNPADTAAFQAKLEAWLAARGSTAKVADAAFLGRLYMATATAMDVVLSLLIGTFLIIVAIFVVNLVLLSLVQRRQEIATGLALGLSDGQTIALFLGEVAVLVVVAWALGSVVGLGLVALAHGLGVPAMMFFPGQVMYPGFRWEPIPLSLVLILPAALAAAILPLAGLRGKLPVDLFREAT